MFCSAHNGHPRFISPFFFSSHHALPQPHQLASLCLLPTVTVSYIPGWEVSSSSPHRLSFPYSYLPFGYCVNGLPYTPAELVTRSFTATPSSLLVFLAVPTVICVLTCPSLTLLNGPFGSHGTQVSYVRKASHEGLT